MNKQLWQVIAYTEGGKSLILGSNKDKSKAWEMAKKALDEQADLYVAVTVKKVML